jgi:uncharacterized protein
VTTDPVRLVLDTNVWLDWLVFDDPGVSALRHAVVAGHAEVWIDEGCLSELARVLGYPLFASALDPEVQAAHLAAARQVVRMLNRHDAGYEALHESALPLCRDPDDQKFLELARDCRASHLVTKDKALLELARRKRKPLPFRIASPVDLVL